VIEVVLSVGTVDLLEKPTDWVWDGGRPSIDFVNTLRRKRIAPVDTIDGVEALHKWLITSGILKSSTDREPVVAAAIALRHSLDHLFEQRLEFEDISRINTWAALRPTEALTADLKIIDSVPTVSMKNALGFIAYDAMLIVKEGLLNRVRECGSHDCGLKFLDQSRGGNRQWCSMRRCGNRAKVSRHRASL